jgi:hypothetical protein
MVALHLLQPLPNTLISFMTLSLGVVS